jgi:hypothetical protein
MKSKILDAWVGQRVIVEQRYWNADGLLLEHGSCWVILRLTDSNEEQFIRVAGNDVMRRARPGELTPREEREEERRHDQRREQQCYDLADRFVRQRQRERWQREESWGKKLEDWQQQALTEAEE